jgi:hypothetical protein
VVFAITSTQWIYGKAHLPDAPTVGNIHSPPVDDILNLEISSKFFPPHNNENLWILEDFY